MPVPPSSPSVGTRYPSYAHYPSSYRSPSTYLSRTTSLDRSSYSSSYGSNYSSSNYSSSSSYGSKYSLPPRPAYSSSSDTYRSSRSLRQSPVRATYSRLSSDSQLEGPVTSSRYTSRYSRDSATRESSSSRDSSYGSRLTSRDRTVDAVNGNGIDTSHFGPSPSSYACNYRWEAREKDKRDDANENSDTEKVRFTDRIKVFETRTSARESGGLLAGHESDSSLKDSAFSSGSSRSRSYLTDVDSSSSRRRVPSTYTDAASRSSFRKTSPETTSSSSENREDSSSSSGEDRQPSVTELRRKYDTNHNITNGLVRHNDEEYISDASVCSGEVTTLTPESSAALKPCTRTDSTSRSEQTDSSVVRRVDSPSRSRVDSPGRSHLDSPSRTRLEGYKDSRSGVESPTTGLKDSVDSSSQGGRESPLVNGIVDKPKLRTCLDSSYDTSSRSRYRRDRVKERIAARLAWETEVR
ncbi:uncharacterized protein [Cherax quadricarinatus]